MLTLVSPVIVHFYLRRFPPAEEKGGGKGGSAAKRVAPGLVEGLRLLLKHPYVMGIAMVSVLFEVIATILDYQMKARRRPPPAARRLVHPARPCAPLCASAPLA